MTAPKRPINIHQAYHAHVYFEQDTLKFASELCLQAGKKFNLKVGRVHQKPIGPHTKWSCQILFNHKQFDSLIPWLEQNRDTLCILVHPLTGNDIADHTEFAYWLGDSMPLNLTGL